MISEPNLQAATGARNPEKSTASAELNRVKNRVLGIGVGFSLLLFLLPTLWFPLNRDQATFALGGQTAARGAALYRDFWDIKPPAIYWVYALPARFFGDHLSAAIAVLDVFAILGCAFLLFRLSRKLGRGLAALGAGAWLVVLTLEPGFSNLGQAETFANLAVLGAALWAISSQNPPPNPISRLNRRAAIPAISHRNPNEIASEIARSHKKWSAPAFGAGLLAGAAMCFKPTCVLPLVPLLLWRRHNLKSLISFAAGTVATPLAAIGALRASGGWPAYLEIQTLLVVPYVRDFAPSFSDHALGLLAHGAFWAQRLWPAAIFVVLAVMEREKTARRAHLIALSMFAGGFVALWVQNRSFAYQWTPMLPAFAFLAASGSVALGEKLGFSSQKCALWCALIPLVWGGARQVSTWRDLLDYARSDSRGGDSRSGDSHARWLARFSTLDEAKSPSALPAAFETARFIRARSKPGDGLFVWAYEPEIYLETGLLPPHSYFLHQPLITKNAPKKWRDSAWRAMKTAPPKFIVLATGDDNRWFGAPPGDSKTLWKRTAVYPHFLWNYEFAARFGRFETYRRKAKSHKK